MLASGQRLFKLLLSIIVRDCIFNALMHACRADGIWRTSDREPHTLAHGLVVDIEQRLLGVRVRPLWAGHPSGDLIDGDTYLRTLLIPGFITPIGDKSRPLS